MNEENLNKDDLLLTRIKDLKEDWTRDEISALLKEDWGNCGRSEEIRYGRHGYPLGELFWSELKKNLSQESLKDRSRMRFGLIVKRTDLRVFPTDEISISTPANYEFDRFQHSSLSRRSDRNLSLKQRQHWGLCTNPLHWWMGASHRFFHSNKEERGFRLRGGKRQVGHHRKFRKDIWGAISTRLGAHHQKWVPLSLAFRLAQGLEFNRRTQGLRPAVEKCGEMALSIHELALSLSKGPARVIRAFLSGRQDL
jgi:hypothetical protein